MSQNPSIFQHIVGIFDTPEFADRYTIAFDWVDGNGRREVLSLSDNPGSPQGVTAWGSMKDADLYDLATITKAQLPNAVIKYIETLEVSPSGRAAPALNRTAKQPPATYRPPDVTNPHDRMDTALELAHRISSVLADAAKKAWENRVDVLQAGLPQADTWPGQALAIDVRDFEFVVGQRPVTITGPR